MIYALVVTLLSALALWCWDFSLLQREARMRAKEARFAAHVAKTRAETDAVFAGLREEALAMLRAMGALITNEQREEIVRRVEAELAKHPAAIAKTAAEAWQRAGVPVVARKGQMS